MFGLIRRRAGRPNSVVVKRREPLYVYAQAPLFNDDELVIVDGYPGVTDPPRYSDANTRPARIRPVFFINRHPIMMDTHRDKVNYRQGAAISMSEDSGYGWTHRYNREPPESTAFGDTLIYSDEVG